jgi:hypothetical protein
MNRPTAHPEPPLSTHSDLIHESNVRMVSLNGTVGPAQNDTKVLTLERPWLGNKLPSKGGNFVTFFARINFFLEHA